MRVTISMESVGDDSAEPFFNGSFVGNRDDWEGDIGVCFVAESTFLVTSLGRYVQNKPLETVAVTLWSAETSDSLASVLIGPNSIVEDFFAYEQVFPRIEVQAGKEYRLTQSCKPGMADKWPDAAFDAEEDLLLRSASQYARFLGGVYNFYGGYPSFRDERPGVFAGMVNFKFSPGIASFDLSPTLDVYQLKKELADVTGVPPLAQQVSQKGEALKDDSALLKDVGVEDGSLLVLSVQAGCLIVTASADKTARLWNLTTGTCAWTFAGHTDAVLGCSFAPSGASVVTASADKTARLWSVESGDCLSVLVGHDDAVLSVVFSPSGGQILTASSDHTARLWSVVSGECEYRLAGHAGSIVATSYSPEGSFLATASNDRTVRLWEAESGKCLQTLQGHGASVFAVDISADGVLLTAAIEADRSLRLWNATTGAMLQLLKCGPVHSAKFCRSGRYVLAACADHAARIWAVSTGEVLREVAHNQQVLTASFSPDSMLISTVCADSSVYLQPAWQNGAPEEVRMLQGPSSAKLAAAAFLPDGSHFVTASEDSEVKVWSVDHGNCTQTFAGHTAKITGLAISP
eukprot:TRINITY_DN6000_c0_g6_i2.p1 TRINITY_DN6000_c0_g6~~TRINITY_DN6000_c0_g6_i2.p1  ORF type:complete len:576 (+),score=95.51 TRINITY_DN6000_c0_g6_i2:138-1865(+)